MDESERARQQPSAGTVRTLTLVAGPFCDAEALRRFVDGVAALPGVREVRILALEQRRLTLALQDAGATPLALRLPALREFPFAVEADEADSLTIRLTGCDEQTAG